MDTTATLYWVPVVPNGAVGAQGVAQVVVPPVLSEPTSRKTITWGTDQ